MLSNQQKQTFVNDGYLIVENVIEPALLERVKGEYDDRLHEVYSQWFTQGMVAEKPEGLNFWQKLDIARREGLEWFQPLDISLPHDNITEDTPFHFGPAVFDLLTHQGILDIAESLLGDELTSNPIQHVRIKPPQRELPEDEVRAHIGVTDWHQDRGVGLAEADNTDMLTVWIAVTDACVDNGCLQIIPYPPEKMYPHCPKKQTAIADGFLDINKAIPAEVKAGGVVLIHPLTPHSAGPNISDGYRWSFDIRYNITGQPTGRAQFPDFIARSKAAPEKVLHDWRVWREQWEKARYVAAHSPHIAQHRWQHDSPYCA